MSLKINKDLCIGCGVCSSMLENVFNIDDTSGVAVIKDANAATSDEIQEVLETCPVEAIIK